MIPALLIHGFLSLFGIAFGGPIGIILAWILLAPIVIVIAFNLYWSLEIILHGIIALPILLANMIFTLGIVPAVLLFFVNLLSFGNSIVGWIILNVIERGLQTIFAIITGAIYILFDPLNLFWQFNAALILGATLLFNIFVLPLLVLGFNLLLPLLLGALFGGLIFLAILLTALAILALPFFIMQLTFIFLFLADWFFNAIPNAIVVAILQPIMTFLILLGKIIIDPIIAYVGISLLAIQLISLGTVVFTAVLAFNLLFYLSAPILAVIVIKLLFPLVNILDLLLPNVSVYLWYLATMYVMGAINIPGFGLLFALASPILVQIALLIVSIMIPALIPLTLPLQIFAGLVPLLALTPLNLIPNFLSPLSIFRTFLLNPIGLVINLYRNQVLIGIWQLLDPLNWLDPIRIGARLLVVAQWIIGLIDNIVAWGVVLLPIPIYIPGYYVIVFQFWQQALIQTTIINAFIAVWGIGLLVIPFAMIVPIVVTALVALPFFFTNPLNIINLVLLVLMELINTPVMIISILGIAYNLIQILTRLVFPLLRPFQTLIVRFADEYIFWGANFFLMGPPFWDAIRHSFTIQVLGLAFFSLTLAASTMLPFLVPNMFLRVAWGTWVATVMQLMFNFVAITVPIILIKQVIDFWNPITNIARALA